MDFDDTLDDGEACSAPFALSVLLVEQLEDFIVQAGIDADSIVSDKEDCSSTVRSLAFLYLGLVVRPCISYYFQQGLQGLDNPHFVNPDDR